MTVSGDAQTVAVLNRLDWQLGEAGRREHRFAWLRDARTRDWLSVDAYYPSNRVVVIACDDPELLEHCEQLVPANGLFLLTLEPDDLAGGGSSDHLAGRLRSRLIQQGWAPQPAPGAEAGESRDARESGGWRPGGGVRESAGAARDARVGVSAAGVGPEAQGPRETWAARQTRASRPGGDPGTGVVLVLILVAELVVGGGVIGLGAGDYVLGFGLVLDACARLLGAVAASQNGDPDAAWSCVLFGSPALWWRGEMTGDAAVLAQLTAIVAGVAVVLGLLLAII